VLVFKLGKNVEKKNEDEFADTGEKLYVKYVFVN
jgi:hypothetical protein